MCELIIIEIQIIIIYYILNLLFISHYFLLHAKAKELYYYMEFHTFEVVYLDVGSVFLECSLEVVLVSFTTPSLAADTILAVV